LSAFVGHVINNTLERQLARATVPKTDIIRKLMMMK